MPAQRRASGRYQKVADALFAQQDGYYGPDGKWWRRWSNAVLTPTEAKTVKSLLKSPEVQHEIDTDMAEGNSSGGRTPTLWVTAHGKSQAGVMAIELQLFSSSTWMACWPNKERYNKNMKRYAAASD